MPKGPQGQKRPADVIGLAVLIGRIATGEVEDKKDAPKPAPPPTPTHTKKGGIR